MPRKMHAVPSAYNIISANRSIGYSFDAAVADIIDNCISAGATKIELSSPPGRYPCLKISDNGCAMDLDELAKAMTFGGVTSCLASRDARDLGRFGMGLKTASLSQCKRLEVISRKDGQLVGGCWDIDELRKNDSWEFIVLDEQECRTKISDTMLANDESRSGTVVIWTKFDRLKSSSADQNLEFDRLMDRAIKKLELIFHRYLKGEEGINAISIDYNGNRLSPNDPFLSDRIPDVSTPLTIDVNGSCVTVLSHKLLHPSKLTRMELDRLCLGSTLLETQGFYIYRAKRLIDYGTWFGMASKLEKTKLSRIQVDIPNSLDSEWSLDIKKSRATPPPIIRQELRNILENNAHRSTSTFHSRRKRDSVAYPYWRREVLPGKDGGCKYEINRDQPLIRAFIDRLDDDGRQVFQILLSNISRYFPFNLVEFDLQQDIDLARTKDNSVDKVMEDGIRFFLAQGMSVEIIRQIYPDAEDLVSNLVEGRC